MNKETLSALIVENYGDFLGIAYNLTRDHDKAGDLTQTTVEKALRAHDSFDGANLMGWIATIMRNTYRNDLRAESKIAFSSVEDLLETGIDAETSLSSSDEASDTAPTNRLFFSSVEEEYISSVFSPEVERAFRSILPQYQIVVFLVDLEGFSYQETADRLGVKVGTVMSRLSRGRKALREALA